VSSVTILTHEQGASSYIAAAFDSTLEGKQFFDRHVACFETDILLANNGAYLEFCKPVPTKEECPWARGKENTDKLWTLSEKMIGETFGN
jgi:hypothetical protein